MSTHKYLIVHPPQDEESRMTEIEDRVVAHLRSGALVESFRQSSAPIGA